MSLIKQALEMICDFLAEFRKNPKNTGMY
jgi:hypothetical protein